MSNIPGASRDPAGIQHADLGVARPAEPRRHGSDRCASRRNLFGLLCLFFSVAAAGCSPQPIASSDGADGNSNSTSADERGGSTGTSPETPNAAETAPSDVEEFWDICVIRGTKVGHVHTVLRPIEENGRKLMRIELEQSLSFRRFGQTTAQELTVTSVETPTGQLVRFESRLTAGSQLTLARGRVDGDKLRTETTTPGKTSQAELDWSDQAGGFFTAELQMRNKPLKPGERRTHQVLLPALNQRGETKLEALVYEAVDIGGQSRRLLKVRKIDLVAGTPIESLLWVDERGDAVKSLLTTSPLQIETRRTTREEALAAGEDSGFDLGSTSVVKIAKPIPNIHATRRVRYRAKLADNDAASAFEQGISQTVTARDDRSAEIEVRAVRGDVPAKVAATDGPNEADRSANNLIQSDAPIIVTMAKQAAPEEQDPWKLAVALEQFVRRTIRSKNFSQAFATAAEVAQTRTGDCTEHAVLLAALCRARGLPARVTIGLVYSADVGGFAYHMWNEVWINDRWVPLDATLGQGGIGGGHLKLLTSNLEGFDAYGAFLPVFRVLGRLELEVLEVE